MKVDVITVEEAKFNKWCWWSNWIDVCVFDYALEPNLLQMRVSRTNEKQFKCKSMTRKFTMYKNCSCSDVGNLTQMKGGGK